MIDRVLLHLAGYPIYTYSMVLAISVLIGITVLIKLTRAQTAISPSVAFDSALIAVLCALLTGRIGYVVGQWPYFSEHPGEIVRLWEGGLTWSTALPGAYLGVAIYASLTHHPRLPLLDLLTSAASWGTPLVWLACTIHGCAAGTDMTGYQGPFHTLCLPLPDLYGVYAPRWPVQPLAAGLSLSLALLLSRLPPHPGSRAWTALLGNALIALATLPLRGDEVPTWGPWRADAWLYTAWAIGATIAIILIRQPNTHTDSPAAQEKNAN